MNDQNKKTPLEKLEQYLKGTYEPRPYLGGLEFRAIGGLDQMKSEALSIIDIHKLPLEIFKVDIRARSISVRETVAIHPKTIEP